MVARYHKLIDDLLEAFWFIPALMLLGGVALSFAMVQFDHAFEIPKRLQESAWIFRGGPTGARAVLGAIASSTIAVVGTVFSITIAALSLASGQMGPRLLQNFTRDRGNQLTFGVFIGTFVYALLVLRTVRSPSEGQFIPHVALSLAILLAFICVATLVWFVAHMAERINVDTVIDLVSDDVDAAIKRIDAEPTAAPSDAFWSDAAPIVRKRSGYLQHIDEGGLADWASEHGTSIRLLNGPGSFVSPNAPIALIKPMVDGAEDAIEDATALGTKRRGDDLRLSIAQLVEVAVRALSAGINDPHTAIGVLDRLGSALCELVGKELPNGVSTREDKAVLVVPKMNYDELVEAMLQTIRQNASSQPSVQRKILQVLATVASCERDAHRTATLQRHADLVIADAHRGSIAQCDLEELERERTRLSAVVDQGAYALIRPAAQ